MLFKLRLIHDVCRNSHCKDNTQKGKMQIICGKITILFVFFMRLLQKCDKRCNSPSKIDQWSKPRPAAKLVLLLARRSPLMLKERAGGSMKTSTSVYDIDYQYILNNHTPPPFGHLLYLRGGVLIRFRSFATLSPPFFIACPRHARLVQQQWALRLKLIKKLI